MKTGDFLKEAVFPVVEAVFLVALVYPLCVENGVCDWRKLWIIAGIPFGINRVRLWMVPKRLDIGGTAGAVAFSLLAGGVIGSAVMAWRLAVAAFYLAKSAVSGSLWIIKAAAATVYKKVCRVEKQAAAMPAQKGGG